MSDRWTPAPGRSHPFLSNDYYFPWKPHPRYLQSVHFTIWLFLLGAPLRQNQSSTTSPPCAR